MNSGPLSDSITLGTSNMRNTSHMAGTTVSIYLPASNRRMANFVILSTIHKIVSKDLSLIGSGVIRSIAMLSEGLSMTTERNGWKPHF